MYFAIALGWSWAFWGIAALFGLSAETPAGGMLMLAGLLGPMIGGIVCTRKLGKDAWRDYLRRIVDVKRIGVRWLAVIALIVPLIFVGAIAIDVLLGGTGGAWEAQALEIAASPLAIVPFALMTFMIGPMEEFGWRGYALPRLQERYSALTSSLVLGVVWAAWHLPLFFIPGSYQNGLGVGTQSFWLFMLGIVPLNVAVTWVFNNTNRSTLAAMLLHFMINFTGELWAFTADAELYSILLWTAIAVALPLAYGVRSLTGRKRPARPAARVAIVRAR